MTPRSAASAETMLTVLAYFQDRGPIAVSEAAADLSMSEHQLRATLNQLWMCGLPGYSPGDLIDLSFSSSPAVEPDNPFEGDEFYGEESAATELGGDAFDDSDDNPVETAEYVELTHSAGITRPLRLTFDEAVSLKIALSMLVGREELVDQRGVHEALQMLDAITTPTTSLAAAGVNWDDDVIKNSNDDTAQILRRAAEQRRAVRFLYHSASSDTSRIRIVDDARVFLEGEHTYLRGFDRNVSQWRIFRVDRIADIEDFGPSREPLSEPQEHLDSPQEGEWALLRADAQWLLDEFPFADTRQSPSGETRVLIPYFDRDWLRRFLLGHAQWLTPDSAALRNEISVAAAQALAQYDSEQ